MVSLPVIESSESLLVMALDCMPGGEKEIRDSTGLRGRAGHMWLLFWHSSGTFPERHCNDGKQFVISKGGESVAMAVDDWWFLVGDGVLVIVGLNSCSEKAWREYEKHLQQGVSVYMFRDLCPQLLHPFSQRARVYAYM
jgi:hypothetical protein